MKNATGKQPKYGSYKARITSSITPEGIEGLDVIASSFNINRSELLERIGRGLLSVVLSDSEDIQSLKKPLRQQLPPTGSD